MAKLYTERDYEKYAQALSKAINSQETPVKQKHVRSAIIGTFHTQGATTFWSIALKLPAMDDRIVAWKLCHVVHKILREGHPLCLVHSQRHRHDLDEIGKLWVHLKEGYGKMIRLYTSLLMTKLDFHRKNPRFPGHLGVSHEELESIGGNDINNYFQMTVEMFDYLDNIIDLQAAVFGSLDMARSNSMTSAGQCRLAPLIPCIQDASKLYDYCVKILFKLHFALPPDLLSGHRQRFLKQFKQLKSFYQNTSNLQYFKDLIAIPPLPENPPNFLIQSDLRTYVTQEVVVPQEPEEEHVTEGSLIDTSETSDFTDNHSRNSISPSPAHQEILVERDFLKSQCDKLSSDIGILLARNQKIVDDYQTKITNLETELATKESQLLQERQVKEDLMNQAFAVAQSQDCEQKVKDEKFNKLKEVYVKLRNDHIQKLREMAEAGKKVNQLTQQVSSIEQMKVELEATIVSLREQVAKSDEKLQKSANSQNEELEALKRDKELFNMETEILKKSIDDACKERDGLMVELREMRAKNEGLLREVEEWSEKFKVVEEESETVRKTSEDEIRKIVLQSLENNELTLKQALDEVDNPALTALSCSPDYLRSLSKVCLESLKYEIDLIKTTNSYVVVKANEITHRICVFVIQGRATGNNSPDINFGEKMAEECKILGGIILKLLQCFKERSDTKSLQNEAIVKLEEVAALADNINVSMNGIKAENLADLLESEMMEMDKAIEEAANRIQDMLTKSRTADSGIKLEVNSKLLDSCTTLMQAIRVLVQKSRLLQAEIVAQGKGTASAKEFYKRNHQWTDGFISAAKAVAVAAKFLLTAADKVVSSNGKLEQMVVAAQEIAASTAQLVVASRVKANRNSANLQQLTQASKGVTTATGTVVATVKDCSQLIDENEELDTSNLTLHQAKTLEMESQVRVLELEKELEQERHRLLALRKHHYKLEGDNEN
ncbi:huntingtin-interacting protein 1 isoform X2 [Tribolium castaneum]|uniref:huntingtin-interacting protein 1 isoform X2 n=1 Tax=Tribolium castaneum TaxID=7070 RepID=UPI00046BEE02|nr:PREDICTED: huntingtin-interacting protein 1 isoform X2 [Tribolium castaneum]|eukprot:XP_008198412.1 PREDICTED: huntingtin-interacting protein 1 isoform X2 [Tribolium castaneum]